MESSEGSEMHKYICNISQCDLLIFQIWINKFPNNYLDFLTLTAQTENIDFRSIHG